MAGPGGFFCPSPVGPVPQNLAYRAAPCTRFCRAGLKQTLPRIQTKKSISTQAPFCHQLQHYFLRTLLPKEGSGSRDFREAGAMALGRLVEAKGQAQEGAQPGWAPGRHGGTCRRQRCSAGRL